MPGTSLKTSSPFFQSSSVSKWIIDTTGFYKETLVNDNAGPARQPDLQGDMCVSQAHYHTWRRQPHVSCLPLAARACIYLAIYI